MYILAHFTQSGTPTTGLTPTLRAFDLSGNSVELDDVTMSEVGSGFYKYSFGTYSDDVDYAFIADGGAGLMGSDRYQPAGNEDFDIPEAVTTLSSDIASLNDLSAADVNAECDTAISDASLATAASIAALNDLSAAEVQAELTTYDAPRRSEVTSDKDEVLAAVASTTGDIASLNDLSASDVQAELVTYDAATGAEVAALNDLSTADIDARLEAYDGPTHTELTGLIATVTGDIDSLNDLSATDVNAEVDTAISDAALATAASVAALNDLSAAEVQAELTTYDAPRRSEATSDKDEVLAAVAAATGDISSLNDLSGSDITNAATTALNSYDPPTRAELTADKNEIIAEVTSVQSSLERALGLLHENVIIDQTTYTGTYMTSARVRIFDSGGNVPETGDGTESTGLVATYTASADYTGSSLDWFRMEKV